MEQQALEYGLYDLLKTPALMAQLEKNETNKSPLWSTETRTYDAFFQQWQTHIATQISHFLQQHLETIKSNRDIAKLLNNLLSSDQLKKLITPTDGTRLLELYDTRQGKPLGIRPDTPLYASSLLTGSSRTPALITQIQKELATCDRADWLVSFIKMSGIGPLRETLEQFTQTPSPDGSPRLRVATTSYMGATDAAAVDFLRQLPNTEVRVSYDTKRTRLHAKSYIFHRASGFGSAYIGSANISKVAMDQGLEWTVKVSQIENPHLWMDAIGAFASHWEDYKEFTSCATDEHMAQLRKALHHEKHPSEAPEDGITFFDLAPYTFQQQVLEDIENDRKAGKNKHLIIAATGTGKTMIAAFDFKRYRKAHREARLLFLVHREEILKQARSVFRQVLRDGSFGEIVSGNDEPQDSRFWFCTIQSWHARYQHRFSAEYFDYVILDEAHHAQANTYQKVLKHLKPQSLLALTATPERSDGKSIVEDFGGRFTHEIRLTQAIDHGLIVPFHYYGIPDYEKIDFRKVRWDAGRYNQADLDEMLAQNRDRGLWVLEQIKRYVADIKQIKAIGFCSSIRHAAFMAELCQEAGLSTLALTSKSTEEERREAPQRLHSGELQIIFTVDLYNEGVDIVDVDTVLFLRPTESLTIFLQQLGRGLRKSEDKSHLDVFDFIAQQNENYGYEARFTAMSASTHTVETQIKEGFPCVPTGCLIHLERQAQETILRHIADNIRLVRRNSIQKRLGFLLRQQRKTRLNLIEILAAFHWKDPDLLYKMGMPSRLCRQALGLDVPKAWFDFDLSDGCRRFLLQTDAHLIQQCREALQKPLDGNELPLSLFYSVVFPQKKPGDGSLLATHQFILQHHELRQDLDEMLQWLLGNNVRYTETGFACTGPLKLHARYTREQILLAIGQGDYAHPRQSREGVFVDKTQKLHIFFADINKSEKDFSETTRYDDFALAENKFHWQSQSTTSENSPTGQSYIHHAEQGYTIMLFIRCRKKTTNHLTAPYVFLGPVDYIRHSGSRPMSIEWKLRHPMPAGVYAWARKTD